MRSLTPEKKSNIGAPECKRSPNSFCNFSSEQLKSKDFLLVKTTLSRQKNHDIATKNRGDD